MRWPRLSGLRRLALRAVALLVIWTAFVWLLLPYDNPALLWTRFVSQKLLSGFYPGPADVEWLNKPPRYPVDLTKDVALIIKTGYGTRARLPAQLSALAQPSDGDGYINTVVVGDFSAEFPHRGVPVVVHDVVESLTQNDSLVDEPGYERVVKYKDMADAIRSGDDREAQAKARRTGWEIDALKFIPGLDFAYQRIPDKKWYVVLDDDTYIFKPSLRLILGHLDPRKPSYLGNAVGDFRARFAHGGSSIIISGTAMDKLFGQRRDLISAACADSLTETWGDKLVATTFMKVGVYLNERHSHFFNGERPSAARISPGRFCSPVLSFHGLAEPTLMEEVGKVFSGIDHVVSWGQLWKLHGKLGLREYVKTRIWPDEDHVGRPDEFTATTTGVEAAEDCARACEQDTGGCLAWTWDTKESTCRTGPWIVIGDKSPGKYSGLNRDLIEPLASGCVR